MKESGLLNRLRDFFHPQPPPPDESNFTPRARHVIESATKSSTVPTAQHLALALIAFHQGVQAQVLQRFKIDLASLRAVIERDPTDISMTDVLKIAEEERRNFFHTYGGTEHLLLATIRSMPSVATFLEKEGCDLDTVRSQVLRELDPNYVAGDESFGQ
jgi:ATP-dependent Clp protease ATP-binding subunit ClpC